ncbi:MAG: hypothetical protein HOP16_18140 [Acidobacteria bacterium]|nr:hypothetical protein [Acidobacteriota bacterium]
MLETLLEAVPTWVPEKYNYFEPVNRRFDPGNLDEALDVWKRNFLWNRRKPSVEGGAWFGGRFHSAVFVRVSASAFSPEEALSFVSSLRRHFRVDLAYIHVPHDTDFSDIERYQLRLEPFVVGLATHRLRRGLPDVPWGIFFGPPYIELFGKEHLLKTPAARVEETANGIYVQLTTSVESVTADHESYLAAQRAARMHLGANAFASIEPVNQPNVPEFVFSVH